MKNRMPTEKKKLEYTVLEAHVINWATDRLEELRDMALYVEDSIMSEREAQMTNKEIAFDAHHLIELMKPMRHFEDTLIEWAEEFSKEYYDKTYERPPRILN